MIHMFLFSKCYDKHRSLRPFWKRKMNQRPQWLQHCIFQSVCALFFVELSIILTAPMKYALKRNRLSPFCRIALLSLAMTKIVGYVRTSVLLLLLNAHNRHRHDQVTEKLHSDEGPTNRFMKTIFYPTDAVVFLLTSTVRNISFVFLSFYFALVVFLQTFTGSKKIIYTMLYFLIDILVFFPKTKQSKPSCWSN